jgi:hypothetical protein
MEWAYGHGWVNLRPDVRDARLHELARFTAFHPPAKEFQGAASRIAYDSDKADEGGSPPLG